jgi:hypothetical protein
MAMGRLSTFLYTTLLLTAVLPQGFAQEAYPSFLHIEMETMSRAKPPQVEGEYVLLSYSSQEPVLRVGVAFGHENYSRVHTFSRNPQDVFVYAFKPPEELKRLDYRLVIDGVWMRDPANPKTFSTPQDVQVSYVDIPRSREELKEMKIEEPGKYTFTYRSSQARRVSLAGSFNRWDPYMYRLEKVPGTDDLFSISLPLPEGTHYYYFIVDGQRMTDPENPDKMVSSTGRTVSVIHISG